MKIIFTHLLLLLVNIFFAACSNSSSANEQNSDIDFENVDNSAAVIDSLKNYIENVIPNVDTQIIDRIPQDSIQTIVENITSSSSALIIQSSSSEIAYIDTTYIDSTISKDSIYQWPIDSSYIAKILPNNGIPYISITVKDSTQLSDTLVTGVYYTCVIQVAGNGKYENIAPRSAKIRMRGNSTRLWYPKKPYRIKFDSKVSMLGLSENKDWVLLANYRDQSKFMNAIAFDMAREMGSFKFVNANRFVEVEVNGDYKGVYQLTEQVEQAKTRVNTGTNGVLLALDKDDGPELSPNETNNFYSKIYKMPVAVKYPKNPNAEQLNSIAEDLKKLEQAIASANYDSVQKLLDVNSFIDFILLQEITRNVELEAPRSMFIYKDESGLYRMGPVWDFDGGFGYSWDEATKEYFSSNTFILGSSNPSKSPYNCTAENKDSWGMCNSPNNNRGQLRNFGSNNYDGYAVPGFFVNLFSNEEFLAAYKMRFEQIKSTLLENTFSKLDSYIAETSVALENDAKKWQPVRPYNTEIVSLKNWLTLRLNSYSSILQEY